MAAAKYISLLPSQEQSVSLFFFVHSNLIETQLKRKFKEVNALHLRQIFTLHLINQQQRKKSLGVCMWYKLSPSNGKTGKARRKMFNDLLAHLIVKEFVIVEPIARGQAASLTLKGELLISEVNTFLNDYYKRIFNQFNMVPII
jgi:hypothetical protein